MRVRGDSGELFELCQRRSARKVEELLAARFPRPFRAKSVPCLRFPCGSWKPTKRPSSSVS